MRDTEPMSPTAAAPSRSRSKAADALCAAAVDLARAAAEAEAGGAVGDHEGVEVDGDRLVTHFFRCLAPAYNGWRWAVTVARASRAKSVTVDEVVLLPGAGALLAPEWVPWSERVRPGDLGVGDLLVTPEDDERLAPAYAAGDDPDEELVALELGLGRVRVLSLEGRDDAAERWYSGDRGPTAPIAVAAPANCGTCGFLVRLGGPLRQAFGVCANEYAPDDGRVVSMDHGCGGHSEAVVEPAAPAANSALVDDYQYELVRPAGESAAPESADDDLPASGAAEPSPTPSVGVPTAPADPPMAAADDPDGGDAVGHS